MGSLFYGSADAVRIPDRTLAHLQVVAIARLRRDESFTLSWRQPGAARHRCTLWMHAAIPLRFVLDVVTNVPLDREILRAFAAAAHSTAGLVIDLTEPQRDDRAALPVAAR